MKTKIIEVTSNNFNFGKMCLARFDSEWTARSGVDGRGVLNGRGWTPEHLWVLDLATGEGAFFRPHKTAAASSDLAKHQIWVCPLFEPFLEWLYLQDLTDLDALPSLVDLPNAKNAMQGYRRAGPASRSFIDETRARGEIK